MSLLNQISNLLGGDNPLMNTATSLLEQNGGVSGLVEKFQHGGLGEIINSWVGTGSNLTISPEQIQSVLGDSQLAGFAAQLGIDSNQIAEQLANHLPSLIDSLTPDGQIASGDAASNPLDSLKGLFNR